jgi:hypothetical protein
LVGFHSLFLNFHHTNKIKSRNIDHQKQSDEKNAALLNTYLYALLGTCYINFFILALLVISVAENNSTIRAILHQLSEPQDTFHRSSLGEYLEIFAGLG